LDGNGKPIGVLKLLNDLLVPPGYFFGEDPSSPGKGLYILTVPKSSPESEAVNINNFFSVQNGGPGIIFTPREFLSLVLPAEDGIKVEVISTEVGDVSGHAPNNSEPDGTGGNLNTSIAIATGFIGIKTLPVPNCPELGSNITLVNENNRSNTGSPVLVVNIGNILDLDLLDYDGSETFRKLIISGFPLVVVAWDAFNVTVSDDVVYSYSNDSQFSTLTFMGPSLNVSSTLHTLTIALTDDLDTDFTLTISATVEDSNGEVVESTVCSPLSHTIRVRAVADKPTINLPENNTVSEGSEFVNYPIKVELNDNDGSETINKVVLQISTDVVDGKPPEVLIDGANIENSGNATIVITGSDAEINQALASLQIKPGTDNGENIIVKVTATSIESKPSESELLFDDKISVETADSTSTYIINVKPVINADVLSLTTPVTTVNGTEGRLIDLGLLNVNLTSSDSDGSELLYYDIRVDSYPGDTQFFIEGNNSVREIITINGIKYLRVRADGPLEILPPQYYSGSFNLTVRGTVIDRASDGDFAILSTDPETIIVNVLPLGNCVENTPTNSVVIEDAENDTFAAVGLNIESNLKIIDSGSANAGDTSNNPEKETISQIVLGEASPGGVIRLNFSDSTNLLLSGSVAIDLGPNLSGILRFVSTTNTITIQSRIIEDARTSGTLGKLTTTELAQAEDDIRAVLQGIKAVPAIEHSDVNAVVSVTVTTIDVNPILEQANQKTCSKIHNVIIQAYADDIMVSATQPETNTYREDNSTGIPLNIQVAKKDDVDDLSEFLQVTLTIPFDKIYGVHIGSVTSANNNGAITLAEPSPGVFTITPDPMLSAAEQVNALNEFMRDDNLVFVPVKNWAGNLTGTNSIMVVVTTTEKEMDTAEVARQSTSDTTFIDIDVLPKVSVL
jgi:hypothetical protein